MPKKIIKDEPSLPMRQKELLIEQLEKTPIIQSCCEKLGIARSTLYRWRDEDYEFAERIDNAIIKSKTLINELAESKVIKAISDGQLIACFFWLKHNSRSYILAQKEIAHEEPGRFQIEIINSKTRKEPKKPKKVYANIVKQ